MTLRKEHGKRRLFGRRKGRPLSARQQRLLREVLPRLKLDLTRPAPVPLTALFAPPVAEVWLEIGFGAGEHLIWQAQNNPHAGLIGCEPYLNGLAQALGRIEELGLANVRLHDDDARDVLDWLPDAALARVFVLFPDPWPKARHAKRRLIAPETLARLARVMAPGAELRIATDIGDHARSCLMALRGADEFAWTARSPSHWRIRPPDWPSTRYEAKAVCEGRKPVYLTFARR